MTIRTPALEQRILDAIAGGASMRSICAQPDMPNQQTVYEWLARDPELASRCARARVQQADALQEQMAEIEEDTLAGDVDPAAARVVLSSKQWRASKLSPKKYGDRIEHEHSGGVVLTITSTDEAL